jgi:hypothetical protein
MAAEYPAEHPAVRPVRGPRHGACPPLAASVGHDAIVSFRGTQEWACPPGMHVPQTGERLESRLLG